MPACPRLSVKLSRTISVVLCFVFWLLMMPLQPVSSAETETPSTYQPDLELNLSAEAAIVTSTERDRRLYAKQADQVRIIPAASQLMTALIACERLPLNTMVTISSVAATAAMNETTGDGVSLNTGDKYPLKYLLLRLIYYHSKAAAIAIAEQISNVEQSFVVLMNTKAENLELNDTVFLNATGEPVYENPQADPDDASNLNGDNLNLKPLQYSTVSDVAKLLAFAMSNQIFADIIRKESEYLLVESNRLISMHNVLQSIWTLSERRITGAYYFEMNGEAFIAAIGRVNNFNIVIATANGLPGQRVSDLLTLVNGIEDNYIQSSLVTAGEPFEGYREETSDGEVFGLIYRRTVNYIHPINDDFIESSIQYRSNGPHQRPIEFGTTIGQVIFQLKDGSLITVDVGPDRQILSSITLLNQILNILQNNRNLYYIIAVSGTLLLLIMLYQLVVLLLRMKRLIQLIVLEGRSRR